MEEEKTAKLGTAVKRETNTNWACTTKAIVKVLDKVSLPASSINDLFDLIECPVCLSYPDTKLSTLYTCHYGHALCSNCYNTLLGANRPPSRTVKCPICRCVCVIRNHFANRVSRIILAHKFVLCSFEGCLYRVPFPEVKKHQKNCLWKPVHCPSHHFDHVVPPCGWGKGPMKLLFLNHLSLTSAMMQPFIFEKSECCIVWVPFQINKIDMADPDRKPCEENYGPQCVYNCSDSETNIFEMQYVKWKPFILGGTMGRSHYCFLLIYKEGTHWIIQARSYDSLENLSDLRLRLTLHPCDETFFQANNCESLPFVSSFPKPATLVPKKSTRHAQLKTTQLVGVQTRREISLNNNSSASHLLKPKRTTRITRGGKNEDTLQRRMAGAICNALRPKKAAPRQDRRFSPGPSFQTESLPPTCFTKIIKFSLHNALQATVTHNESELVLNDFQIKQFMHKEATNSNKPRGSFCGLFKLEACLYYHPNPHDPSTWTQG